MGERERGKEKREQSVHTKDLLEFGVRVKVDQVGCGAVATRQKRVGSRGNEHFHHLLGRLPYAGRLMKRSLTETERAVSTARDIQREAT